MIHISISPTLTRAIALSRPWSRGSAAQQSIPVSSEGTGVMVQGYISGGNSSLGDWTVELIPLSPVAAKRTELRPDDSETGRVSHPVSCRVPSPGNCFGRGRCGRRFDFGSPAILAQLRYGSLAQKLRCDWYAVI